MSLAKVGSSHRSARSVARAEAVGSLLRPKVITDGIDAMYSGMTTALRPHALAARALQIQALNKAADAEISRIVQHQIDAGLDVVTDGELRRPGFLSTFYDGADGLGLASGRFETIDSKGEVYAGLSDPVVTGPLTKSASPLAEEATFMRSITDYPFKVTIPAPSYFLLSDFVPVPGKVYPHRQQFLDDIVAIEQRLVLEAIAAGANWIQFDFPLYPAMADERYTDKLLKESGIASRDALLQMALAADTEVTKAIPSEVTVGMHLCRGNLEGGFWSGSLAPIAERMFGTLPHDRFLFEWEDISREGDYQPIKHVPKGRIMAMGLVSTKKPQVETVDELVRRIEEAGKYLDINQLALTTQCGFASLCGDHLVRAEDSQWRKLEVIGKAADRVWGAK